MKGTFYDDQKSCSTGNIRILNLYAHSNTTSQYIKQNLSILKEETHKSTIMMRLKKKFPMTDRTQRHAHTQINKSI